MKTDAKPVTQYEKEKRNGVNVITTVIIGAMGVNFVVAGITTGFYECSSWMFVMIGVLEIILALIIFYASQFKFNRNVIVKGFLIYNRDNKEILPIPYYEISIWMFCKLKSFCSHNEELSHLWNSHYIHFLLRI